METDRKNVVIVGAGMAGLTAAAYLTRHSIPVLLLDKNDRIGGLLSTFENRGFFFDSGPRAFINSGILKPILKELGIECEFLENKISIGVEDQLFTVNSMDDLQEYRRVLVHLYPQNKTEIDQIIAAIEQLSGYTKVLYEFDNPNFMDLTQDKQFIFKKLIPWTFKLLLTLRKFNQFNTPMEVFLGNLTKNQSLIDILIQHFFRNTPAYFALGYFHVYMDYFYPRGGTGTLAESVKKKVLDGGAQILLNKKIVQVVPSASKIIDSDGNEHPYDHLIWAADLKSLYRSLNAEGLDPVTTQKIETEKQRVLTGKGAESVFITFMGVNRSPAFFKQNGGEHLFYTPSRQGLGAVNQQERIHLIENFEHMSKSEVLDWLERYLRLNTFEISIPVLRDPSLAPEGKTGVMVSCLFDYQVMKAVEEAGWYDEFKEKTQNLVIDILSESIYKGLKEDLLFKFSSSPLTIEKIAGSSEGAITGWSFEGKPPVYSRLQDMPKSAATPIPNVYQAGQWAYSPAGVPIAMLTGWTATRKILKLAK